MVRAKFRLNSYTTEMQQRYSKDADGKDVVTPVEKRTLNLTPVYSNEPGTENKRFWDATPSGSIQLGVVNQAAWDQFQIGKEYYVDFTPVEE